MMVWKIKNHVDLVIPSENILALCLNKYEPISKGWFPVTAYLTKKEGKLQSVARTIFFVFLGVGI
jgi:hypothetical protein